MVTRYPSYYKDFHCIADKCKGSCCAAGWEIDIDEQTANYYKTVSGNFGKRLNENIEFNTTSTSYFKLKPDGRCPFLNEKNLCDIYTKLGKDKLCEICKEHPRFYEFFEDVTECGIGLYCEEAARIILTQEKKFSTYNVSSIGYNSNNAATHNVNSIGDDSNNTATSDLYKYLCSSRAKIFNLLNDKNISLNEKLKSILWYAYVLQQNIENNLLDEEELLDVTSSQPNDIIPIIEFLAKKLEPNDKSWPTYLMECIEKYSANKTKLSEFENSNPNIENYLTNISIYFIYRYFLKATFDEDVLSKVKLMVTSVVTLKILYFCNWLNKKSLTLEQCITITKKYCEEIECSDETLQKLAESSYDLNIFSTEYLIGALEQQWAL